MKLYGTSERGKMTTAPTGNPLTSPRVPIVTRSLSTANGFAVLLPGRVVVETTPEELIEQGYSVVWLRSTLTELTTLTDRLDGETGENDVRDERSA